MENQEPRSHARLAAAVILVVVIGASLIGSLYLRTNSAAVSTSTNTTPPASAGGASPTVLVLHSPAAVESATNRPLILPNVTSLGPSYKIVGASVGLVDPTANDSSQSVASIYIWNGTFVNGTTTDSDILQAGGVMIVEGFLPSSFQMAQEVLPAPSTACVSSVKDGSSSCTTITNTLGEYLVGQGGETILVNPDYHVLFLVYPNEHMAVTIYAGSRSVGDGLELASSLTQGVAALQG